MRPGFPLYPSLSAMDGVEIQVEYEISKIEMLSLGVYRGFRFWRNQVILVASKPVELMLSLLPGQ
jgi:hypothetical protein